MRSTHTHPAQVRQLSWIEKLRRDGCMPLQTLGFCTGAALTVIACLTFAAKLLDINVGAWRFDVGSIRWVD